MAIAVGGLAKFYTYFKTGASYTDLISKTQKEALIHDPIYQWEINNNKGVELDEYTRQQIQDAYTAAWYILNRSNAEQKNLGLEDKFSKRMLDKILHQYEASSSIKENRVDLDHNINLHLFSYDRQIASFTDSNVKIVRKVENQNAPLMIDTVDFDIVMGLEDGYWKVFEMLQLEKEVESSKGKLVTQKKSLLQKIQGINYYPTDHPWLDFWPNYVEETSKRDLDLAKELGFNHLRIFLPYAVFGKGSLNSKMVKHLDHFLDSCTEKDMTVTLSLFDFPESYHLEYYSATRKHLLQLLSRYKDHPAVTIWDLKNEADLDFQNYGEAVVMDWLFMIIKTAQENAPNINLTIGWSDAAFASYFSAELDLLSFHIYKDPDMERKKIKALKSKFPDKPFYVSEFGMTSYQSFFLPFGSTAKEQAIYTKEILNLLNEEGIEHYAFWTLHDFTKAPKEVIGPKPWIRNAQKNMGLIKDGKNLKLAAINFETQQGFTDSLLWHERIKPAYLLLAIALLLLVLLGAIVNQKM